MAAHVPAPNPVPASDAEIEAMKILHQHWQNDTNVINVKLIQYIAVQSLILLAVQKTNWGRILPFFGILTSGCWFFSMTRTHGFRRHWERVLENRIGEKTELGAFNFLVPQKLKWWESVPSSLVQIAIPVIGLIFWVGFGLVK